VLVPPPRIRAIEWNQSKLDVDLTRDAIKQGPELDASRPLAAEDTRRLEAYYQTHAERMPNAERMP